MSRRTALPSRRPPDVPERRCRAARPARRRRRCAPAARCLAPAAGRGRPAGVISFLSRVFVAAAARTGCRRRARRPAGRPAGRARRHQPRPGRRAQLPRRLGRPRRRLAARLYPPGARRAAHGRHPGRRAGHRVGRRPGPAPLRRPPPRAGLRRRPAARPGHRAGPAEPALQRDRYLHLARTARGLLADLRAVEAVFRDRDRELRARIAGGDRALAADVAAGRRGIADSDQAAASTPATTGCSRPGCRRSSPTCWPACTPCPRCAPAPTRGCPACSTTWSPPSSTPGWCCAGSPRRCARA